MLNQNRTATSAHRLRGITALSIFFLAGAAISLLASLSLRYPDSFLESMWRLNPHAHENLLSLGRWAVLLLAIVSVFCASAAIGLWGGSRWGHWLAIGLIATNLIADITNVILGTEPRAIVGIPIAGGILLYLLSKKVRSSFRRTSDLEQRGS